MLLAVTAALTRAAGTLAAMPIMATAHIQKFKHMLKMLLEGWLGLLGCCSLVLGSTLEQLLDLPNDAGKRSGMGGALAATMAAASF